MSDFGSVTCLTIVAESVIEERILAMVEACGARGWTVSMAEGDGPSHHGASGMEGGNVRVETLVTDDVAERIWASLETDFFPHYAVSAWAYDVRVARMGRYS